MTTNKLVLGLDIGASSVKYGWGDCQQGLQFHAKKPLTSKTLPCLKDTVARIVAEMDQNLGLENLISIGIGTPGTLDLKTGKIVGVNPNMPYWVGHKPEELIPPKINVPVCCDNDANLMTLAEAWLRGSNGKVTGVTVGSGIGSGFVEDGQIYHGSHGYAMELGHITVHPGGELCSCGRKGCLETYASVEGIRSRIKRLGGENAGIFLDSDMPRFMADLKHDPDLERIVREGMNALAIGLANTIVLFDPDLIVLGGGAMDGGLYDIRDIEQLLKSLLPQVNAASFALEKALVGNRAGVLGAIILASQG